MVVSNPLYSSVVGSNSLEESIYADIAKFYGLSKASSISDLATKQAQATTSANSLALAINNPAFRTIPTVQASQNISQAVSQSQTYHVLADAFAKGTKTIELPAQIVSNIVSNTQKQVNDAVNSAVNEPIKKSASNVLMLAVIAFVFYLLLVKR